MPVLRQTARGYDVKPGHVRVVWAASTAVDLLAPKEAVEFEADGKVKVDMHKDKVQVMYRVSKAANVLLELEMGRREGGKGIVSCVGHLIIFYCSGILGR